MLKRNIYIASFITLGILVSFLIHAGIEIPIINLLVADFDIYNLGLTWKQWQTIHDVGTIILLALGIWGGYRQGMYWWRMIYIEKRFKKPF